MGSFDDESTLFYASEIVSALEFLHCKCRIIHRDLKPENILIGEDRHLMVSDFGSAKSLEFDGKEERPIRPGTLVILNLISMSLMHRWNYKVADMYLKL